MTIFKSIPQCIILEFPGILSHMRANKEFDRIFLVILVSIELLESFLHCPFLLSLTREPIPKGG